MNHVLFREATLVSSMADLVHDVIPQSANPQTTPEKIEWVSLQKCVNVNDRKRVVDVVVLGLARGYQIWARMYLLEIKTGFPSKSKLSSYFILSRNSFSLSDCILLPARQFSMSPFETGIGVSQCTMPTAASTEEGEQMNCHKDDRQALINVPERKLACEMKLIRLICF
ncbi:unnamed protein product [Gongylonema pulchrum]|uniref:PWWP domain-containing protein n=1 Tax=Gongylonema pulchrum TaxID=637853 RepID=A0A183F0B7_9BILA|nr:unnamed protein product [Gongylonema pulchrum]